MHCIHQNAVLGPQKSDAMLPVSTLSQSKPGDAPRLLKAEQMVVSWQVSASDDRCRDFACVNMESSNGAF
jgi:hypothetical protein